MLAVLVAHLVPAGGLQKNPLRTDKNVKKTKRLRMYTRTGPYVVTYMMLIIMLTYVNHVVLTLYNAIFKILQKNRIRECASRAPPCGQFVPACSSGRVKCVLRRSLWLFDRVFCPRCLKMTEDGPKMAPRWPQAGLKLAQHGS